MQNLQNLAPNHGSFQSHPFRPHVQLPSTSSLSPALRHQHLKLNMTLKWNIRLGSLGVGWLVVCLISVVRSQNIDSLSLDFGCQPCKPSFTVVSPNQDSQPITKMRIFAAKLMHTHQLRCVAEFRGILYGSILVPRCCKLLPLHGWLQQNSPAC